MVLDWPRYWRISPDFKDFSFADCIKKMNTNPDFSEYYDNAISLFNFSNGHENWYEEINRDGISDIIDYYKKTEEWFKSVS